MGAMLDAAPPEADQPALPERPVPPSSPVPSPRAPAPSRANALATLGFAVLTLGSLAVPWAGYDDGSPSWSGFDIMGGPPPGADGIGAVVACLHILQWLSVGLIVLSALRLIVPARRLAWLSLAAALALVLCAVLAAFRFHSELQGIDAFAPSMRAGPVVTAAAAFLCAVAAGRGPAATRAR